MNEYPSQEDIDAAIEAVTHDPRTFTQHVIDRIFPHPLKPYGSVLCCGVWEE